MVHGLCAGGAWVYLGPPHWSPVLACSGVPSPFVGWISVVITVVFWVHSSAGSSVFLCCSESGGLAGGPLPLLLRFLLHLPLVMLTSEHGVGPLAGEEKPLLRYAFLLPLHFCRKPPALLSAPYIALFFHKYGGL